MLYKYIAMVLNMGVILPSGGHLVMSGRHFGSLNWGLEELRKDATGIQGPEDRDDAKHPKMHNTAPTTVNYPTKNVNSATVKKPWQGVIHLNY